MLFYISMARQRIFTDIEALKIIQEEECEAFKVFKQDYSSSEASSSGSESEGISDIDCVDSYSSHDSSINIVPDTPPKKKKKKIENLSSEVATRKKILIY